ncbi:hypothetical protein SK128_026545 [Halocaridina rubra]|uniref:Uncharacterized protein n=1 Tax=Halocaridina rubra TaxID=373956 RepID=A0AAN8ZX08_HALRR
MDNREQGESSGATERGKPLRMQKPQRQQYRRSSSIRTRSVPGKSYSDISIAGVSRVCNKRCGTGQRWVWCIVLIVCTTLMMAQVWDRVTYYLSMPVSVNVRVTRNQTLRVRSPSGLRLD